LAVRKLTGVEGKPEEAIRRGDQTVHVDNAEVIRGLSDGDVFQTHARRNRHDQGWAELGGKRLRGDVTLEDVKVKVPVRLLSAAHACSGRGGVTVSYSAACDPVACSWLSEGEVDSVFVF
jgi:hypothetical protein